MYFSGGAHERGLGRRLEADSRVCEDDASPACVLDGELGLAVLPGDAAWYFRSSEYEEEVGTVYDLTDGTRQVVAV